MTRGFFKSDTVYCEGIVTSLVKVTAKNAYVKVFTEDGFKSFFFRNAFLANKKGSSVIMAPSFGQIGYIKGNIKDFLPHPISISTVASLKSFCYLSYLCEIAERLLPEEERSNEMFSLLKNIFFNLALWTKPWLLRAFELKILHNVGLMPDLKKFLSTEHNEIAINLLELDIGEFTTDNNEALLAIGKLFLINFKNISDTPLKSMQAFRELRLEKKTLI